MTYDVMQFWRYAPMKFYFSRVYAACSGTQLGVSCELLCL
jgi:hypothetical protein